MHGAEGPHVVLVGGFLTEPFNYLPLRRRLVERGAAAVTIAPLHLADWLALPMAGFGPLLLRTGRVIREARARSDLPLLVVGHSAGGLCARLAMSPRPFEGRRTAVSDAVGCLVTLGTPHVLPPATGLARHRGHDAAEFLEAVTPGAWFAPQTAYLTVGSSRVRRSMLGPTHAWGLFMRRTFRALVGPIPEAGSDGVVPLAATHLAGATQLIFEDVLHGYIGSPWYGDGDVVDRWWPVATDLWRAAIEARGPLRTRAAA